MQRPEDQADGRATDNSHYRIIEPASMDWLGSIWLFDVKPSRSGASDSALFRLSGPRGWPRVHPEPSLSFFLSLTSNPIAYSQQAA
jgi:hypothetical protein